ncbi:hypothetical protein Nocox_33810 [Nonomuraea coxensis DSM 45129]|uniref:Uncharacterized protein n=1 Tax=Nonomuraea coxensis DSM 45129 TaxID=1122611 RepID=A0ABX8U997_9ACTN|nr:hypothetical protein [Nonomuraea coxensis]QYC44329.1 hypothetical protein Nocox_33810 [Nonomuraea coxensis DSM 45129]
MFKRLAVTVLTAAAATTLLAAPADASTSAAQLIRTKVSWGHCEDTCKVKVRIKNISRKRLYNVKLNVSLKVNGRKVGSCYDSVGTIRPYGVRHAACTVRTARLSNAWNDFQDYGGRYYKYASTNVSYRYYR